MTGGGMDRRRFLQLAAAAIGACALRPFQALRFLWERGDDQASQAAGRLMQAIGHRRSARAVGRAYLATAPQERSIERLIALLTGDRLPSDRVLNADAKALRAHVQEALSEDFAAGRTVSVRGWMLSLTEARLCALAVLWRS
jgi:hypothetical protein